MSAEDTEMDGWIQSALVGVQSRIHDSCYHGFHIVLSPHIVLVEFADGASFERVLRKKKKTQG